MREPIRRHCIVMTNFNREEHVLRAVLSGLAEQTTQDFDLCIVDDGSTRQTLYRVLATIPHDDLEILQDRMTILSVHTGKARADAHVEPTGHNNPAYAFNQGINFVHRMGYEYIFLMSSDMVMTPDSLRIAIEEHDLDTTFLHAKAYSLEDNNHPSNPGPEGGWLFCGSSRPRPLGWFWGTHIKHVVAQGGYDERFCGGIAYEDDDVTGRIALQVGTVVIDDRICGRHLYHASFVAGKRKDGADACMFNAQINMRRWGGESSLWSGCVSPIRRTILESRPGYIKFAVSHPLWNQP